MRGYLTETWTIRPETGFLVGLAVGVVMVSIGNLRSFRMKLQYALIIATAFVMPIPLFGAQASHEKQLWIRQPAISPDASRIAFSFRGQIFTVPAEGGTARAETAHGPYSHTPIWSPDSRAIAFASDTNGHDDVFLTRLDAGDIRRLTWTSHAEIPTGFAPDESSVLFTAKGLGDPKGSLQTALTTYPQLYTVDLDTDRRRLLLPVHATAARWDHAGERLAYVHNPSLDPPNRQHRAASNAHQIWIYDALTQEHVRLPEFTHDARNPVWARDGRLFYLGEASGTLNVHVHDFETGESRQFTHHEGRPVRSLSLSDDGDITYARGGAIYLQRHGEDRSEPIKITIAERLMAQPETRATFATAEFTTSPDGALMAAVMESEIVLLDRRGNSRRITTTAAPRKNVAFSPDGSKLVYAAQRDHVWGIYAIDLQRETFGDELALVFEETPLVFDEENASQPAFSPDGAKLGYVYARREVRVLDLETGETATPFAPHDYNTSWSDGDAWFSWSPDSRHLLVRWKSVTGDIVEKAGIVPADASAPIRSISDSIETIGRAVFSSDGTQIIATTPVYGFRTADQGYASGDLYRIFMSDEARADFLSTSDGAELTDSEGGYVFQDERNSYLEERLTANDLDLLYLEAVPGAPYLITLLFEAAGNPAFYGIDLRDGSIERLVDLDDIPIQGASYVPANSSVDLVTPDGILTVSLDNPEQREFVPYTVTLSVDARERRRAAFEQVWADVHFKYYSRDIEGRDWDAIGEHYRGYLDSIASDREFADMIREMFGEISGSHLFSRYYAPEQDDNLGTRTASLGIFPDRDHDGPGERIAAILPGGPLDRDDLGVNPGDIILSVDGRPIPDAGGIDRALDGLADRPVKIGVVAEGQNDERLLTVRPINLREESALDKQRWIDTRREHVTQRSRGCIVYAYLSDMDNDNYITARGRLLSARDTAQAALVDIRANHGGNLHRQLLTLLGGEAFSLVGRNEERLAAEPFDRWIGPSAVVVDSYAYSDGSIFPQAYQDLGIGPLIGDRLRNTGTGISHTLSQLVKGLDYSIPVMPYRHLDGRYYENTEIVPDIPVAYDPNAAQRGEDPKLDAAIDTLMETIGAQSDCR